MHIHSFSEVQLLSEDLALQIKELLHEAILLRGHAYLVVSGGKTPVELFKLLANSDLPWHKVTIALADERCVPANNSARNERLVSELLLQNKAKEACFISLYHADLDEEQSLAQVEQQIKALPTFDVVILGMGEDGHTASLFPDSVELALALAEQAPDVLVVNPQSAPHQRISLSKKRLLDSRTIFIHLIGAKKRIVFNQAMAERDPMIMPISAFLNQQNANIQVMYAP